MAPSPDTVTGSPAASSTQQALTRRQIKQYLQQHLDAGCADILAETQINHFEIAPAAQPRTAPVRESRVQEGLQEPPPAPLQDPTPTPAPKQAPQVTGQAAAAPDHGASVAAAQAAAQAAQDLDALYAALESFEGCGLKKTAKSTVFCDGQRGARVMLVGEAPGQDEDRHGTPFVGESGKFLDLMLSHIGLSRQDNLYISNIIAWRPPGNRPPTEEEIAICRPFITRHIELAQPDILLLVGGTSAKTLLNVSTGITRLRGTWHDYDLGERKIPAMPLLHPAYILRRPETKADMWGDLCLLKALINKDS